MIHVVFQAADVATLQAAFELDTSLAGAIVEIKDDYAVGPLQDIYEPEGYQKRRAWWKELIDFSPYNTDSLMQMVDDRLAVHQLKRSLEEDETQDLWLWMGQNQHDVCGYYWLMTQLPAFQGRVHVLYLNNLPFINEKGNIFYPTAIHQIQPKEFLKAKKLARKITPSEFEVDPDEWRRLCTENALIRILEGGKKIAGRPDDFYDKDILSALTPEPQKGSKAMFAVLSKMKIKTGDTFLLWRMKHLAAQEEIELTGDPSKGWKEFEVRLKTAAPAGATAESNIPL